MPTILPLIEAAGLSIRAVERQIGVSNGSIRKWARGEVEPGLWAMVSLADALGVCLLTLLGMGGRQVSDSSAS